ncbi:MAG: hypothetical protein KAT34_17145 [Candidatus Aminicenantes bacterium]|nr:hypothetical protein [Candidatus Aminicenantes bacterium]
MGFEPGGRADKLGNRYEGRWVVKQLLHLLNEEIRSVTLEAIGDDEEGVDLWLEYKSGKKEAHQCKARNESKEHWSVRDLTHRGVLANLRFQLDKNSDCEFFFVSGVPATLLGDICDSARNSNSNPEDFYQYQVKKIGQSRYKAFKKFCETLGLNDEDSKDRAKAFDYLRRTRTELYPYDSNSLHDLLTLTGFLLTGEPEAVVSILSTYAEDNDRLGNPIFPDELREYLKTQNIYPKNLSHDTRIFPAIERLQQEFDESISNRLINNRLIHREESDECLNRIESNEIVILHGAAGSGKSGVLYELTNKLRGKKIPFLPLRLDRRIPSNTAYLFGQDMGLPDSPTNCLVAVAEERLCVLILDQLDAIRWTAVHSYSALDVCKELVAQVKSFRREGKTISVVLSCRTFDLEHDPEIRSWLDKKNENNRVKLEVRPLAETTVRDIVGTAYDGMTGRQREILSNPQNLGMWVELRKQQNIPSFRSSTELMRKFWKFRRRQIEETGVAANDINTILNALVGWLEKEGKITAPVRTISSCSTKAVEALKSHGIIREQHGRISFCHQSYLDFLIAEQIIDAIEKGGSILGWLGTKEKQTLFRREQLRQALALLSEELPDKFLGAVKESLSSRKVRFHLKHLVLELIGQIESLSENIADYCIELLHDGYWSQHVFETVFLRHVPFVQILINRGIISRWLHSGNDKKRDHALLLLSFVSEKIPDQVTEQLTPFMSAGGDWPDRILNTICWSIADDSQSMFEMRLRLARNGVVSGLIHWEKLCKKYPERALRLIEAVLSTWDIFIKDRDSSNVKNRLENWYKRDKQALTQAAERCPKETLNLLFPHIERLTSTNTSSVENKLYKWNEAQTRRYAGSFGIAHGVVELLKEAGKKLAEENPQSLFKWTVPLEKSFSATIQEILIEIYSHLPAEYADRSINWLLADSRRFRLGDGYEAKWMPAVRLIKALSPHCSIDLFSKLEQAIRSYYEPEEKRRAKDYLPGWKNGYFDHYWGHAQYFLLPALSPERIDNSTADLINVLKRKFKDYPEWRFVGYGNMSGGLIGSKLDHNLERISDRAWLNIIGNKNITEDGSNKWEQVSANEAVESSIWQFSRSLSKIAHRFSERFGRLALSFPDGTHHLYISAILDAMALTKPGSDVPDDKKLSWQPASIDTVLAVWDRFRNINDSDFAMSFCGLMEARADEKWSDSAIEKLIYFAINHPDLLPGKLNIHCDITAEEAGVDILYWNTINCVRGIAAGAIAELLWHHQDWLDKLKPGIESLIVDQHPVVRMAAVKVLLPMINIDRHQAVNWFCELSEKDARIPASRYAIRFFNHTISEFHDQLRPIISRMVNSKQSDVSQQGAEVVTAYSLFYDIFKDELESCRSGTVPQRKGVAKIAASLVNDDRYAERCRELLQPLFNDPDEEVRSEAARIFNNKFFDTPGNLSLAKLFVTSKAFSTDTSGIFYSLEECRVSLLPYYEIILSICRELAILKLESSRNFKTDFEGEIMDISPLLLRLYEQAQEEMPDVANRCLDAWDLLFEKRVGITRELTKSIEK